jgi:multiple sugar transport system substrate-binding protein
MNNRQKHFLHLCIVALLAVLVIQPAIAQDRPKLVYWGGLIFSEASNNLQVERIEQWGQENGVDVEVVMINQNEIVEKVSAAIEAGTVPDVFEPGTGFMLLLSQTGQLEPLDDLYVEIGEAHGGWLESVDAVMNNPVYEGVKYGIPYGANGNVLYRRIDILEPLGYTEAPTTWEELGEMAIAANNPPEYYGAGIALSNVGDGNLTQTMLQSWGGRIADDEGKTCALDSPETREFLTWITELYGEGVFPPGATTWDGAGDNTAYQSGQAVFIANPGSVRNALINDDPELESMTRYSALPDGPTVRVSPAGVVVRSVFANSANKDLAKQLIANLAEDDFIEEYYNTAIYAPALQGHIDFAIFTESAVHAGLLDLALNGTPAGFPDVDNAAYQEFSGNFTIPKMIQRVVVDGLSIDDAVVEAQAVCAEIYAKYE